MFPDDAKQVKEMMKIPIIYKMIRLNHSGIIKFWSNPSNSERVDLIQNDSIQFKESSPILYSSCLDRKEFIYIRFIPFLQDSFHSIQRKFIHITFIPVK